jgi:hypothetical protein
MSFCVNCGVKLKQSEKVCPLCNTKVINSNNLECLDKPVYSILNDEYNKINHKFVCELITIILIIISLITILCNLIFTGKLSWAIYVLISMLYLNSKLSFILFKNKYIAFVIELISTELLLFVIAYLNNGLHWYMYLVGPIVFVIWLYVLFCMLVLKSKKYNFLRRFALCFSFISLVLIVIEGGIDLFRNNIINFNWSVYAIVPITILSIIMYIISYNSKLLDEIKQRIFIKADS